MNKREQLRRDYPPGTRVRLIRMDDKQAPPPGTEGTVEYVDDIGTIHVRWDTGSGLGLVPQIDEFERCPQKAVEAPYGR